MEYDLSLIDPNSRLFARFAEKRFGTGAASCKKVGAGFYGTVYLLKMDKEPYFVIVKWYKHPGRNLMEKNQLDLLRRHSLIKIPEVYLIHRADADIPFEALAMEYIPGVNAAKLPTEHPNREEFADRMVENLLHLHGVTNEKGFGPEGGVMFKDWRCCLRERIANAHASVHRDFAAVFSPYVMKTADRSFELFDRVFSEPVVPSLVHSDYNLWNLIVEEETARINAVIDPIDAGWADREMDLFHLQNADGDRFELLERYRKRAKLSEMFPAKNAFYRFWDDIRHMLNMGWYQQEHFTHYAGLLNRALDAFFAK